MTKLKWRRFKSGSYMVWTSGPYMIMRWACYDNAGKHYAYDASFKNSCLHGQEPFYDFGQNKPLEDAKRLCEAHAEMDQLMESRYGVSAND